MAQSGAVFKTLGKLATIDYSSSKDYFVFTMRERRASQENKKRRRKSKVCSYTFNVFYFFSEQLLRNELKFQQIINYKA